MLRVLLREVFVTVLCLAAVSAAAFTTLDTVGHQDWFSTAAHARAVGLTLDHAGARDLPLFWNPRVEDSQLRTDRDLAALADPARRPAAQDALLHRGTAALPYILPALPDLAVPARTAALEVLSHWARALTGGDPAPVEPDRAMAFWARFYDVRALDFRPGYALRQAQRILGHSSRNATAQITRLGTFALPAIFQVLATPMDRDARIRLTSALADVTGIALRAPSDAPDAEVTRVVEAWRACWFAEHLEYQQLSAWQRALGHVAETRYGRWLARALRGRFGISAVTLRPVSIELRERLPASAFVAGLGGLLATAFVVAFGGGPILRRRPLRPKLLDLAGALVPGLAALGAAWALLVGFCAPGAALPLARATLSHWPRLIPATVALALAAGQWIRRPALRLTLHTVRVEAETWAAEGFSPGAREVIRHGARIGVASLLAPLGLAAPAVLLASLVIEPALGVHGMGALTMKAMGQGDAPWLMVATLTVVPIFLGRRWTQRSLIWLLTLPQEAKELATDDGPAATEGDATPPAVEPVPPG